MKIKTADLIGPTLDWAVASILGVPLESYLLTVAWMKRRDKNEDELQARHAYEFSTQWGCGGPIIEREKIELNRIPKDGEIQWCANGSDFGCMEYGPTPLIAAMRCYCASKLGDEVEVPDELA